MNGILPLYPTEVNIAPATKITEDLYFRFIEYLDVGDKSVAAYSGWLKQFFEWMKANRVQNPNRRDILNYRSYIKETLKATTVQNYMVAIRRFFAWTEMEGIYPNVAKNIKGVKVSQEHKKDALTKRQARKVLASIERDTLAGKRDYAILALMLTCGLRDIEVIRANIDDIRPVTDFTAIFIQGKGRDEKTEYVRIHEDTEEAIRDYLIARGARSETEPLFTSTSNRNKNGRMRGESLSRIVKTRLRQAGFNSSRITAHSLRHTSVTISLLAGKPIQEVKEFARHRNIRTTLIYDHSLEKAKNSCGEAVSQAIFGNDEEGSDQN